MPACRPGSATAPTTPSMSPRPWSTVAMPLRTSNRRNWPQCSPSRRSGVGIRLNPPPTLCFVTSSARSCATNVVPSNAPLPTGVLGEYPFGFGTNSRQLGRLDGEVAHRPTTPIAGCRTTVCRRRDGAVERPRRWRHHRRSACRGTRCARRSAESGRALVHQHLCVRQGVTLSGCSTTEQHLTHARCEADGHGADVVRHELHDVVDREAGQYRAASR